MNRIEIGNIKIDVIRKDIKNIHLSVHPPKGRVRIASPLSINEEAIRLFAISKLPWIKHQQRKFQEQERETKREYLSRESHYFFGKRYLLKIIEHDHPAKVILNKATIDLYVKKYSSQKERQAIMNEWYRKELKREVPELLEKWRKIVGVSASDWGVRLMKTKWGTCNRDQKRICLNLELAKKPISCLEYIIAHELIHLLERHHNDTFMHYMDSFMPQWKKYRDELNHLPVSHVDWSY